MHAARVIGFLLGNLGFVLFVLAIIIAGAQSIHSKGQQKTAEIWFRWMVLLPFGVTGLYAFMMHAFFGDIAAAEIGWANSPFQLEVAMANLGFGILGVLAFKASWDFRLAVVIGAICWFWGDAFGHIYQMIVVENFTPGNAGSWFWLDIVVPLILVVLLFRLK